ncbi:hypothetical protein QET40_06695 [Akkermansia sp. N21169]|uniref:hypothetical protein n=1 Tax=Akkermansia sp. N21169 TaxID=3040765 RepID=UPI00244E92DE|nr:hypothetical protein [Akkermansia sp. N21169]MDH3068802.1 hypothetical protein [Akkermansia sp. N21169]
METTYFKRKANYRECTVESRDDLFSQWESRKTLEELFDAALLASANKGVTVISRKCRANSNALEELMAPNMELAKFGACKCGCIIIAEEGKNVPAKGKSKEGVFITSAEPVTKAGVAPPVESTIVFAITGNHIAYISNSNNGDARLQSFLSWLFLDSRVLSSAVINLKNKICIDVKKQISKYGVSSIDLSYASGSERSDYAQSLTSALIDSLEDPIVKTDGKNPLDECSIKVTISPGGRRHSNLETITLLASRISETDLDNLKIKLKNGITITKDKLVPHATLDIPFDAGVINSPAAMRKLSEWLTSLVEENTI